MVNDPVQDPSEALYIRDDITGEYWTTTALPVRTDSAYLIRHGQGYSIFEHSYNGIKSKQTLYVPEHDPIKITKLSLENHTDEERSLSLFFYVEWVLGVNRGSTARFIVTDYNNEANCMLAYNRYNEEFGSRTAFVSCNLPVFSYTSLRSEFLGSNGSMENPSAMKARCLSNRAGVWHDPCSVIQVQLNLAPGRARMYFSSSDREKAGSI